jgi:hypothetical protein
VAMVSSDLRPEHGQAEAHPRAPPHRPRVSMLVPLRRLAKAPARQFRAAMTSAALVAALGVGVLLCALLASSVLSLRQAVPGNHPILVSPTDTIEAWLRHMTITSSAPTSPDGPALRVQPRVQEFIDGHSDVADQ